MNNTNFLLNLAVEAAISSGKILANQRATTVDLEQGHDIKLKADKESERRILDILSQTDITILSEECGLLPKGDLSYYWVIDPLDGSLNYLHSIPMCCISISLWRGEEEPVFGVVYDFNHDNLYTGVIGKGAFCNGKKIMVSDTEEKGRAIIATGFPVYLKFDDFVLSDFVKTLQSYKKVRLFGSAALSCTMVAQGSIDVYNESNIAWWDVAAGVAIIRSAGGKADIEVTDRDKHLMNVFAYNGVLKR